MTALLALQARFQDFLLHDHTEIVSDVSGGAVDPRRRLGIYYDAYRSRLVEALGTDYTALRALMGADAFDQAALRFVTLTPSTHRNLRWYGQSLPAFLLTTAPYNLQPWLADLATFEWAITLAFDAEDQVSLTFEQVATLAPEAWPGARFRFHPSLQRLPLGSNAPALRQALDSGNEAPEPVQLAQPLPWALWRRDLTVMYRSLPVEEAWALDAARNGSHFTELCEGLCQWLAPDAAAASLAGMLRTWVEDQLVVGLET